MRRVLILTLGLGFLAACAARGLRAEQLRITGVRSWTFEEATRIAVELSGDFEYHQERLSNPDRIFFDIHARIALRGKRPAATEDKLLRRIRVAETQPGLARIVLDLTGPVDCNVSKLSNPDRLMIELRPPAAPSTPPAPVISTAPKPPPVPTPTPVAPPASAAAAAPPFAPRAERPVRAEIPATTLPEPPAGVLDTHRIPNQGEAPKAARRASDGHSSLTRALGLKVTRVVIDPGHGGHDQGTTGVRGLLEKDLVLDVAMRLGKLIETNLGSEVIYTRTDDTFIPLGARTQLANDRKADLFISIHANSSPYSAIRGVETYYLNFTSAKDALDTAARENASSDKSIFELRDLIQQITLHEKLDESKEFAGRVQVSLQTFERSYSPTAKNRGIKKAPFVVLIGANMPSILCEIGFLSNPREEALLKRPEHRQKLADALYRGLAKYAQSLSHFQVAQAGEDRR